MVSLAREMDETIEFELTSPTYPLGIIAMEGAKELSKKIDRHLVTWYKETTEQREIDSFILEHECPRFATGDAKGILKQTVRGHDIFIICDVGNYSCRFKMHGMDVPMSPDEHYADLKRIIQAINGKAWRINVIMPTLYGGRQDRRNTRESLDCAVMLQELERMGVENIVTFDAHDTRVQNSVPLMSFDNVYPSYQYLKALLNNVKDLKLDNDHMMFVSPDEGAISRNLYFASVLGLELGMFYKRRDFSRIVNGSNPIVAHEFIGADVAGKDIFIADDIIASGDSMLDSARELKKRNAKRIFIAATYGLFTRGLEIFDEAYKEGTIAGLLSTNLTYQKPELKQREWYIEVDASKYAALLMTAINNNNSVSPLMNPLDRIERIVSNYKAQQQG